MLDKIVILTSVVETCIQETKIILQPSKYLFFQEDLKTSTLYFFFKDLKTARKLQNT